MVATMCSRQRSSVECDLSAVYRSMVATVVTLKTAGIGSRAEHRRRRQSNEIDARRIICISHRAGFLGTGTCVAHAGGTSAGSAPCWANCGQDHGRPPAEATGHDIDNSLQVSVDEVVKIPIFSTH